MTALYSVALSGGGAHRGRPDRADRARDRPGLAGHDLSLGSVRGGRGAAVDTARARGSARDDGHGTPIPGLWRDRLAWCVSGFMGFQSFGFYATLSWLPTIAEAHGVSASNAGLLLSLAAVPA